MQRTDTLIKVISVLVFIAIVLYIGLYLYDAQANPLTTAAAMEYTIKDSVQTEGYAVRTEEVLGDGTTKVSVMAEECEKLSAGSTYAIKFASRESMEAADKAMELETRIQWLEALALEGDTAADTMAKDSLRSLAYSIDNGDLSSLDQRISDINVKVFHSSDFSEENIQTELENAKAQLEDLENQLGTDIERLTVSQSGIFSGFTDGFETVTSEQLKDITPSGLSQLFSTATGVETRTIGKLVTDISWRYAALVDADDARKLDVGKTVDLEFSKTFNGNITMKVESIGTNEDGRCVVVFVGDRYLTDTIATRELTANIVFSVTKGIRIPKEAIHKDEETGQTYVYIISGVQALQIDVTILTEYDDYYLVESGGNLRDGMEIIVHAKELYSGKVVR